MHPTGVASAAWVFAAAPSKVPFYVTAGLLAGWAVLLSATGLTHPDFPGSLRRARLTMLTTALLVVATATAAVATAGEEGSTEGAAQRPGGTTAPSAVLELTADPRGALAYEATTATVKAGEITIRLVNDSSIPHNVTIAEGSIVVARTKTIQRATTTAAADLRAGDYVFFCSVDGHRQGGMRGTLIVK